MNREDKRRGGREERRTEGISSAAAEPAKDGGRTSPGQFLKEVRGELRKVAWPNRKELGSYTVVVLVFTTVLVGIVWAMDEVFRRAVIMILG